MRPLRKLLDSPVRDFTPEELEIIKQWSTKLSIEAERRFGGKKSNANRQRRKIPDGYDEEYSLNIEKRGLSEANKFM